MNIFQTFLASIRSKISPLLTKLKMWFTPSYIKNRLLVKLRKFFISLTDVKPRDSKDYYGVGGWLISKKLAFTLTMIVIICCLCYILAIKPVLGKGESPYRTYKYNSFALKFVSDKVCILGKSGYKAYVGDVDKGVVAGTGTLYNKEGNVVYEGEFDANAYNGAGKRYYENTGLWYSGEFKDNLFHGTGELYREDGTKKYEGEFSNGCMEGSGMLYSGSENLVYTGSFLRDEVKYQELLGKDTATLAQMYTGSRKIYQSGDESCVILPDIGAAYRSESGKNSLEEEWSVGGVYVFRDHLYIDGQFVEDIAGVKELLGEPEYEGNTEVTMSDATAINEAVAAGNGADILYGKVDMKTASVFDEVVSVEDFDDTYLTYLYIFQEGDMVYTFFCKEKDGGFSMYLLEE